MRSALIPFFWLTELMLVFVLISPKFIHVGRYDRAWGRWHDHPTEENRRELEAGRDELMAVEMKINLSVFALLLANSLVLARVVKAVKQQDERSK